MPFRIDDGKPVFDYTDGETVYLCADGFGEMLGVFDAVSGHIFVDGKDFGTPEEYPKEPNTCILLAPEDEGPDPVPYWANYEA